MDIDKIIAKAQDSRESGDQMEALKWYSRAFDILIKESNAYAMRFEGSIVDKGDTSVIMPQLFIKAKEYLKKDISACQISTNMGTMFAELGDFETARTMYRQAIDLRPDESDFLAPEICLKHLEQSEQLKPNQ